MSLHCGGLWLSPGISKSSSFFSCFAWPHHAVYPASMTVQSNLAIKAKRSCSTTERQALPEDSLTSTNSIAPALVLEPVLTLTPGSTCIPGGLPVLHPDGLTTLLLPECQPRTMWLSQGWRSFFGSCLVHRLLTGSPYSIGFHTKIQFLNTFLMGTLHSLPLFLFLPPCILNFLLLFCLGFFFLCVCFVFFIKEGRNRFWTLVDTSGVDKRFLHMNYFLTISTSDSHHPSQQVTEWIILSSRFFFLFRPFIGE